MLCKIENCRSFMFYIKMANISKLYNYRTEQTDEELAEKVKLESDGYTKCILLPKRDLLYVKPDCTVQELFDFYRQDTEPKSTFNVVCHRYDSTKDEYVRWCAVTDFGRSMANLELEAGSKIRLGIMMVELL